MQIGAIYARISTGGQKDNISIEHQIRRMEEYAASSNILAPKEYYFTEQVSGYTDERLEYTKIRTLIREKKINVLIVYSSDRLTREKIHGAIFRAELRKSKCELHYVSRGKIDIYTAQGELFNTIEDAFNQYWGSMIRQTTMEKKQEYTAIGIPLLQGTAPFGYQRIGRKRDAHLEIVEDEACVYRNICTWFLSNISVTYICDKLAGIPTPGDKRQPKLKKFGYGIWTPNMVYRLLREELYIGVYYANKKQADGTRNPKDEWKPINIPAIIDKDTWLKVQDKLDEGQRLASKKIKYEYLIARKAKCKHCGYGISTNAGKHGIRNYYMCNSRLKRVASTCNLPFMRVESVDDSVWTNIVALLSDEKAFRMSLQSASINQLDKNKELKYELQTIEELIQKYTEELNELLNAFKNSKVRMLVSIIEEKAEYIEKSIQELQRRKEQLTIILNTTSIQEQDITDLFTLVHKILPLLENINFEDKRYIIDYLGFKFKLAFEDNQKIIYICWRELEYRVIV